MNTLNTTSFQTNQYNHAYQTGIQGTSGLKIMSGEDLSNRSIMFQHMVTVKECNRCNLMPGGGSKWNKNKEEII